MEHDDDGESYYSEEGSESEESSRSTPRTTEHSVIKS